MLYKDDRPRAEQPTPNQHACWTDFARVLGRIAFEQHRARLRTPLDQPERAAA